MPSALITCSRLGPDSVASTNFLPHEPAYASRLLTTVVQTDDGVPMHSVQPISCLGHSLANRLSIFWLNAGRTEIACSLRSS